jgi:hypothetical protein
MTVRKSWVQAETAMSAEDDRLTRAALLTSTSGISGGTTSRSGVRAGAELLVTAGSGLNVLVNAGAAIIQGTISTNVQGAYLWANDTQATLAIAAGNPTNPRRDLIVASVVDPQYAGINPGYTLSVVQGTPAGSPVDPTPPANSLTLSRVTVPANAASVAAMTITDLRPFAVASGGVTPCVSSAHPANAAEGMPIWEFDTDTFKVFNGTVWIAQARQPTFTSYTFDNAAAVVRAPGTSSVYIHYTTVNVSRPGFCFVDAWAHVLWLGGTCFCNLSIEHPAGTIVRQQNSEGQQNSGNETMYVRWKFPVTPGNVDIQISAINGGSSQVGGQFTRFTSNVFTEEF